MTLKLSDCRVKTTIDVVRGKWKLLIIKALRCGRLCYGELRRSVPEATHKVLTQQLRQLKNDKIIDRQVLPGRVIRVEYSLTAHGRTLIPILTAMHDWGKKHQEALLTDSLTDSENLIGTSSQL